MSVQAIAKGVRISPRKTGVVASMVRWRSVNAALVILEHTPRRSALAVAKVIKSAQANAENNHNYKPGTLRITEITVTPGPRLKRYKPAAHGRALPFQKKSSHIRVLVDGDKRQPKKATKASAEKKEAK